MKAAAEGMTITTTDNAIMQEGEVPATSHTKHWPSTHKAYDHAAIEKCFKDRDFEQKERTDIESLKMALNFVTRQVDEKRRKLQQLEADASRERFETRAKKNQIQAFQDQIGTNPM